MTDQLIFIIGATGNVGKTLVDQLYDLGDTDATRHPNPTIVVGLASSSQFLVKYEGIPSDLAKRFAARDLVGTPYDSLDELSAKVQLFGDNLTFVDVTSAGREMINFHLRVLRKNQPNPAVSARRNIVTANKNPVALSSYEEFQELTGDIRRYGFRSSVMAGAESVTFLRDAYDLGDEVTEISGVFSGTLGFLTTELHRGINFSDALQLAMEQGYTEPDPRDDLSGLDVARKLVVLARTAGYNVGLEDVKPEPFIFSEQSVDASVDKFLESTRSFDRYFSERVAVAEGNGGALRYVASFRVRDGVAQLEIGLKEVPGSSPLAALEGTANKIQIITDNYGPDSPYIVEAPGAGREVTARNVRRDLLDLQPERRVSLEF